ncbi:hypothetical protein ACIHDR_16010 [Nocardia sp. NPDC052278]
MTEKLLIDMPTADFAALAWRDHGAIVVAENLEAAYVLADR